MQGYYAYQADTWCSDCGEKIIEELRAKGLEETGDTDQWPQWGSISEETDCPDHCSGCGAYLDLALTSEGQQYVIEHAIEALENGSIGSCVKEWVDDLANNYGGLSQAEDYVIRAAAALPVVDITGPATLGESNDDVA